MLDRFELRTEIRTPLCVGKLRRDIFLQSLLDLGDLKLSRNVLLHSIHPFFDVEFFEQRLLLRNIDIEVRRQKIGELLGILDVHDHQARLFRGVRRQLEQARS
jgi:hypothetical protein